MSPVAAVPSMVVEIDGRQIRAEQARALGETRVRQRLSMPTLCELTFFDVLDVPDADWLPGAGLRVTVAGDRSPLFAGEITAVEYGYGADHGRELRVRGYDLLHRLRKRQPVRAHVQVTLANLARELIADLGVSVDAAETGPIWHRLIQCWQSDLEFLAEMAQRCGLYFFLDDDVLRLLTLDGAGEAVALELGRTLFEACIEVNGDSACRSVAAAGWDPLRVVPHEGRATTPRVGRAVAAAAPPHRLGGTGERTLVDRSVQDDRQAEAIAQAELDLRVAQEVVFTGVAEGHRRLRPGVRVDLRGVAAPLAGRYVLTSVDHVIDSRRGFVSEMSTAPPVSAALSRGAVGTVGVVTSVADPEELGRVQVSLPTYGNVESEWMEVLTAGAGAGKGLVALPDVGDHVLVLFADGDPAQGVVLGGLYGTQGPPDAGVEEQAVRRYTFLTPGGQRVRLDDARKIIRLENSDGSFLELSPEKVVLHANVDLEIEAPDRALKIRAKTIDFERV